MSKRFMRGGSTSINNECSSSDASHGMITRYTPTGNKFTNIIHYNIYTIIY